MLHRAYSVLDGALTLFESESDSYGLIHADTNLTNWLFQPGKVALLDFEVCCYGFYMFDVSRILHELKKDHRNGGALMAAFHHGYSEVRTLPALSDIRIQAGMLMSLLDIVAWVCQLEPWMRLVFGDKTAASALSQMKRVTTDLAAGI